MTSLTVDIVSDLVCPWCFIGVERLLTAIRLFDIPVEFTLRFHPFLLDAAVPEAGLPVAERLQSLFGTEPDPHFDRVNAAAHESGLALDARRQPNTYPTVKAHTLIRLASAHGAQLRVVESLFFVHFVEAGNIASNATLVRIGAEAGLDPVDVAAAIGNERALDETRAHAVRLVDSGVTGVPFFLLGSKLAVSGAQTVPTFMQALRQVVE